jgi:hypothetical protein
MRNNSHFKRAASVIVLSLLMAFVLYPAGLLGGNYLWSRFGPPPNDPDQTYAFTCGIVVGGFMAVLGVLTSFGLAPR